ncbi:hypothetical protein [Pseudomonas sp. dw_358]|uniref:hypothetical protein n=1 Tax=Pseudomonas sp. dw_358 TaxID=2720083 RepID=UPI001BD5A83D|nr:hypothetical protein [Pseudomonas sp. dw_358]
MKIIYRINRMLRIPGLPIARIRTGNETCTLRNDGWVIVSDGRSTDALPITFCSQSLIDKFEAELA